MSSHKNRIAKLEDKRAPKVMPRVIVLKNGIYTERGQVLSEADYIAIATSPANDVTLINIVRASEAHPISTVSNGDYSFTVGIDVERI
jgi:hypothetical protein